MINWLNQRKNLGLVVVTLAIVLALVLTTCAPAPKVEEHVVKIGLHAVLTGALATQLLPCSNGYLDYVKYVNDQGGINGIKLDMIWEDTAALVPRTIIAHKRFERTAAVMECYIVSSCAEAAATGFAARDEMPGVMVLNFTERMLTKPVPWLFGGGVGLKAEPIALLEWIQEDWTENRPIRFGYMFFDLGTGWDVLDGLDERVSKVGAELVGHEVVPMLGAIDTSVEWLRLAGKNPDWVYMVAVGATLTTLLKDAARLEIQKKGINICGYVSCIDKTAVAIVGTDAERLYTIGPTPLMTETHLPGVKAALESAQKYRNWEAEKVPRTYLAGWVPAGVAVEGIRLAIEKVGIENLSGQDVREGLVSIKDFDNGLTRPITMGNDWPFYGSWLRVDQVQQGKLVPVSKWRRPPFTILDVIREREMK